MRMLLAQSGATLLLWAVLLPSWCTVGSSQWVTHGADRTNRRWSVRETVISPATASNLTLRWAFTTRGDVSATPAVSQGVVYFPDWAGYLYAVNASTGALLWERSFQVDYGFGSGVFARATPALAPAEGVLVIGTYVTAYMISVSLDTGALRWKALLDSHPSARITGAASLYGGYVYVGVASGEEDKATDPGYPCCSFVGSLVKQSLASGDLLWKTYTLPRGGAPGDRYAGAAIWGATPPVDPALGLVYAATGNLYVKPASVEACEAAHANQSLAYDPCIIPENHQDSVVALDLRDGTYRWSKSLGPIDAFNLACILPTPGPNCPPKPGPDYDFGMLPSLVTISDPRPNMGGMPLKVTVTGQKSGIIICLEASTGLPIWTTQAGPGGSLGGASWGLATDGVRVYVGIMNNKEEPFDILTTNETIRTGAWVALDASTGKPLWYFPDANPTPAWSMLPSVANGVVFAGSADPEGHVYALDASTGSKLWDFPAGASVYGGVSIADGCIFFGTGYSALGGLGTTGGGPQKVYSFCV